MLKLLKADPPMVALLLTSVLALIVAIAFGPTDYLGDMAKLQAPTVLSEILIVSASARAGAANLLDEAARLRAQAHSHTPSRGMAMCGRRWSNRELRSRSRATSARIAKLWLPARGCHWKSDYHGQAPIIRSSFALDLLHDHRIYEISAI